jgi:transcriptional regulator with GAF, ATPase, and Fis domain
VFVCHLDDDGDGDGAREERAARSTVPLLILGETGTGKDHLARRLHEVSGRSPWVPVNCGALPRDLIASELFGHVRGAFSGATAARVGLFASAHGGTLFLDEVCELPLELQPALLRALEGGNVRAVGAEREVAVDVRIIAATNRDPTAAVRDGHFRADLHARLSGLVLQLEPLRCRRHHFSDLVASILRETDTRLVCHADALEALLLWDFPYNVRELKTLVLALQDVGEQGPISLEELEKLRPELAVNVQRRRAANGQSAVASLLGDVSPKPSGRGAMRDATDMEGLVKALRRHDGHLARAAEECAISRQRAQRLLQRFPERDPRRVK